MRNCGRWCYIRKEIDTERKQKQNQGPFGRVKSVLLAGKRFGKVRIESKSDGEERMINLTTRISFFSFFPFFFLEQTYDKEFRDYYNFPQSDLTCEHCSGFF